MDSLDAQCLVIALTEREIRSPDRSPSPDGWRPPDLWYHHRSGALSWRYERGERVFSWPPEAVSDMARRWRDSDTSQAPPQARLFADAHQRLEALAGEAGLGPADVMIHDLRRAELRAVWEDREMVVVIEEIGEGAPPEDAPVRLPA